MGGGTVLLSLHTWPDTIFVISDVHRVLSALQEADTIFRELREKPANVITNFVEEGEGEGEGGGEGREEGRGGRREREREEEREGEGGRGRRKIKFGGYRL